MRRTKRVHSTASDTKQGETLAAFTDARDHFN